MQAAAVVRRSGSPKTGGLTPSPRTGYLAAPREDRDWHPACECGAPVKVIGSLGRAGYSLIELATVLVALSILSIVSYTKLAPALEHGKVNGAAAVMAGDLAYAQLLAARQRTPVVVIVTGATQSYVIRDRANGSLVYRTRYLGTDTSYNLDELSTSPASSLQIFPTGVTLQTTTFTLGLRGYKRQVKFTKAGQVRISKVP